MTIALDPSANLGPYKLLQRSNAAQQRPAADVLNQRIAQNAASGPKPLATANGRTATADLSAASAKRPALRAADTAKLLERLEGNAQPQLRGAPTASNQPVVSLPTLPQTGERPVATPGTPGASPELAKASDANNAPLDALLKAFGTSEGDEQFDADSDLNGDGNINAADLLAMLRQMGESAATEVAASGSATLEALLAAFGTSSGQEGYDTANDLNGDGNINAADLLKQLQQMDGKAAREVTPGERLEAIRGAYGMTGGEEGFDASLDLNADGSVNAADLLAQLRAMR